MRRRAAEGLASIARAQGLGAVLGLTAALLAGGCHESDPVDACTGVDCSGHGRCVLDRVHATCLCDTGYVAEGLTCVPDEVEGEWALIEAGEFIDVVLLGSPETEAGRRDDELLREVIITRDFVVATTEVTQAEFEARMGRSPSSYDRCGPECPVESVTWHEAAAYCNALSDEGDFPRCYDCVEAEDGTLTCEPAPRFGTIAECTGYRLPTEAEWEYAARGGTATSTWNGDLDAAHLECEQPNEVLDTVGWFCGNSFYSPRQVGQAEASPYGLFDVLGNVSEWCHDWYAAYPEDPPADYGGPPSGSERAHRGGSFEDPAALLRSAARSSLRPAEGLGTLGLRPVRTVER